MDLAQSIVRNDAGARAPLLMREPLRSSRCLHSFSPYPKKIAAWPLRPGSLTTAPKHLPVVKSNATTSSWATQYSFLSGPNRRPRGLLNPVPRSGARTRTRLPSARSYSRVVVTASGAPNGCSLLTTTFPLGAIVRSSGLRSGSSTFQEELIVRSGHDRIRAVGKTRARTGAPSTVTLRT